ncbi:MAG: UDP-N-acetylmuramoyl-tripeptide--D-alanyl-D-alanine ligase [Terrimicrobiaceae bacterium]
MNSLSLEEISVMCGAAPPRVGAEVRVRRLSKDSRTLVPGDLYLALRGGSFDGNAFVSAALARGAAAAIVDDPHAVADLPPDFPVILVEDSIAALYRLASSWRDRLALRVVSITGSNGKTSTKDFTAAVLGARYRTIKTDGNLNNHIGLPLSILAAEAADEAAVWEIGMNHPGEIAPLAALARPDVGIVTNIGVAHIEHLGSREGIAREKAALLEALKPGGVAIIPDGDDFADFLASRTPARVERVGGVDSPVRAESVEIMLEGTRFVLQAGGETHLVSLPVPGRHMVSNALLAVAAGLACGLTAAECAEGLSQVRTAGGRLTRRECRGVTFYDDTYNANPDSMVAALEFLKELRAEGRKIAVLGRMGELGLHAADGYAKVGRSAAEAVDFLVIVGAEARELARAAHDGGLARVKVVESPESAASVLREFAEPGDLVLVKGSRSARMEGVLEAF